MCLLFMNIQQSLYHWVRNEWGGKSVGGGRGEGGKWEFLEGEKRERKYERLTFLIQQCVRISKTRTQNVFDLHLTSSQLPLRLLSK